MSRRPGSEQTRGSQPRLDLADELELHVEKLITGGDGMARWQGLPIFIPRAAPGDRLRVRLTERRPDYGRAEILEILEPGPGRRVAPCPHFVRCGGCDLQHLEDDLQASLREASVRETLTRLGGVEIDGPLEVVRGTAWAYRQRAQIHTEVRTAGVAVGYRARGGRELVGIDECPVLVPELEAMLPVLAGRLDADSPRRLDLLAGDGGRVSTSPKVEGLPHGELEITVGGLDFELDARCFFQGNRDLLAELTDIVVGGWTGNQAFDLFAGVGFFALPLARRYDTVLAVEGDRVSARYLQRNARRHRLPNLESCHSAIDSWIDRLPDQPRRVVVDPPRPGLTPKIVASLCRRRAQRLTYVSCHPATLARDLRRLTTVYRIERITVVDMFPQTGHVEVVVQLVG